LHQNIYFPVNETPYGTAGYIFNNLDGSTNNPYADYPSSSAGLNNVRASILSGPVIISKEGQLFFKSPGIVTLTASSAGNFFYYPAAATGYIIVDRAPQSITFPTIANQTNVTVNTTWPLSTNYPTASSGLPVSITVAGPARITGKSLLISGAGTVTLTAKQPGNPNYYSATPVTNSFTVTLKQ